MEHEAVLHGRVVGDHLVPARQALLHGLVGGILPAPPAQGRVILLADHASFHAGDLLQHGEPGEPAGGDVEQPYGVASEEAPPLQLRLHERQVLLGLLHEPPPRLALRRPQRLEQRPRAPVGGELRPEAGGGAGERVGRQERRALEGFVDVLDDDERLGDGADVVVVAVEEQGHLLVHGVVPEQQLALAAEVLLDELVRHPLQPERRLGTVRERAPEGAQQPHRHRLAHLCFSRLCGE
uniref:Uncharacterized protein n=1 Tax=Triticum urartu TaxID=4572 RepID=A0A8R7U1I7_TRIUA